MKLLDWKVTNVTRDADGAVISMAYQCDAYDPEVLNHRGVPYRGIAHGLCRYDTPITATSYSNLSELGATAYVKAKISLSPGGVDAVEQYAVRRCDKLANKATTQGLPW